MKTRICPKCGYKYPALDYVKTALLASYKQPRNCPKCQLPLKINRKRRLNIVLLPTLLFLTLGSMDKAIMPLLNLNLLWYWVLNVLLFVTLYAALLSLDIFEDIEEK